MRAKMQRFKNLVSITLFILILLVYLFALGEWYRPEGSSFDSYYEQPKNSIDVILVGSSHVYCGYVPAVLWREYGISAYNVYGWSMPFWTGYYYTKEALLTQHLDVVFVDVGNVGLGANGEDTAVSDYMNLFQNINFHSGINRLGLLRESFYIGGDYIGFGGVNDLTLYHEVWKYPDQLFSTYQYDVKASALRNFGALSSRVENEVFNFGFYQDSIEPAQKVKDHLDKFVRLSKKEQFKLVFILTPFTASKEKIQVINWVRSYASEHSIDFIDFMGEAGSACEFDLLYDMADEGHVRYTGAIKLTRFIGEYLLSIGYKAHGSINSEQIDKDAEIVYQMLEEMLLEDARQGVA